MSEEKNIVILLRQPPHGTLYPVEGLRMSVAVSADFDPITIAINDGVYTFYSCSSSDKVASGAAGGAGVVPSSSRIKSFIS